MTRQGKLGNNLYSNMAVQPNTLANHYPVETHAVFPTCGAQGVSLPDVAAALSPGQGHAGFGAEPLVQLDALLGLACLLSSGSNRDKLQLCFWTLDK